MSHKRIIAPHEEITYKIIGCAMDVHRQLGPGFPEEPYERDLEVKLEQAGLSYERQKSVEVFEAGALVGYYIIDLWVAPNVIVELKALGFLDNSHLAQVVTYLVATGSPVGLLLDFGGRSLRHRRILPPKDTTHRINRQWLFVPEWLKAKMDAEKE